jgi:hypothetical protein
MVMRNIPRLALGLFLVVAPVASALADDNAPPAPAATASPPPSTGQVDKPSLAKPFEGLPSDAPFTPTGTAELARDGQSLLDGPVRPCGAAAHETDGTTTCIGVPAKRSH